MATDRPTLAHCGEDELDTLRAIIDAPHALTQRELAERLRVHPATICRRVVKLQRDGLLRHAAGRWRSLTPTDLGKQLAAATFTQ